jgi:hypothetical protein
MSSVTIDDFWKLVARVDRTCLKKGEGHDEAAIRPLVDALAALEKADLQSFQDHLAQALHDLDGRAYFDASAEQSDDSFLYVRCFVVAMGQNTYKRTLLKPRLMPKRDCQWCEPLLYAAQSAWKKRTGEEVHFETKVSFESGSNEALWPPEKERDWREEAKAEIKWLRREAKKIRARAPKEEFKDDWLKIAANNERMAEKLEQKLRGEPE